MYKQILRLALPNIITNITVPLLGMVDLAIVGHIGNTRYIGAIAIATMIFSMIYWLFGFLRMGTSGFTAQAYGADDMDESADILFRSLSVGLTAALCLIVLQKPIIDTALMLVGSSTELKEIARRYFYVNIWAAPATLLMYGFKGWFIGMQNSKIPMMIAIAVNIVNIVMSLIFVFVLRLDIEGVALGTVIAQYTGLGLAFAFFWRRYDFIRHLMSWRRSMRRRQMKRFFSVNLDIFLRTVCLIAVFSFFPIAGSKYGDNVLAINTLLMQFYSCIYACLCLCGRRSAIPTYRQTRYNTSVSRILPLGAAYTFGRIFGVLVGRHIYRSNRLACNALRHNGSDNIIFHYIFFVERFDGK